MKASLTLLFLFFILNTQAQNYNCFQTGTKGYFINGNNYVRGMRIDSVKSVGSDSVFYPYRTQRISYYLPSGFGTGLHIDTLGASWLGKNVIKHSDGTFVFDNYWDTVFIKTQAHTGDSWSFFNDTTRFSYIATVVSEDTLTVKGVIDSIKKIKIIADSAGVVNTNDPVNNFQIILSKNHGFVQAFDLFTFPYHYPGHVGRDSTGAINRTQIRFYDYYLDLLLGNLGTCDLGCFYDNLPDTVNSIFHLFNFHNPTRNEIYHFSVGDVYEYHRLISGSATYNNYYVVDSVLSSTTTTVGTMYNGSEYSLASVLNFSGSIPHYDTSFNNTPFSSGGDTNLLVDPTHLPEEWNSGYLLRYFPDTSYGLLNCKSANSYEIGCDFKATGFGYTGISSIPSTSYETYTIGFGMSGWYDFNAYSFLTQKKEYVYYKKDTTACGSYVNVHMPTAGISHVNADNSVFISPNPASDHIDIIPSRFVNTPVSVSIYDMSGRSVFSAQESLSKNITINTSLWDNGMYIVTLADDNGTITRKKIVVMR